MGARIAILLHADHRGGAERAMRKLAETLAARGHEVDVVLLSGTAGPGLAPPGARLVELGAPRVLRSVQPLSNYLKATSPSAVLSGLTHANVVAVLARRASSVTTRLVLAEHVVLSRASVASHRRRELVYPRLAARLYKHADALVCLSPRLADDTARVTGVPRDRISVIPLPVSPAELREAAEGPPPHPWLAPGEPPVILGLGRLERVKAFERLIAALSLVRESAPARLMILGEGRERVRLERLAHRLGIGAEVTLPGWAANPYPYMARASVVALSSLREGLPTVLIEALALGRPVVAVDCDSGPREILAGGSLGRLIPPGDGQALAAALAGSLDASPPTLPEEALAPYDPERVADAYLEVLLAADRGAPAAWATA